jgi:hypothetical protein
MITVQTGERQHEMESDRTATGARRGATWLSAGGLVGAAASGACCVIPFALFAVGVSGAPLGGTGETAEKGLDVDYPPNR